jgi:hypothetical protein
MAGSAKPTNPAINVDSRSRLVGSAVRTFL